MSTPTPNTRIDTALKDNKPLEPQANGSERDDAMARSEQWADGTVTRAQVGNTRTDQARKATKPKNVD